MTIRSDTGILWRHMIVALLAACTPDRCHEPARDQPPAVGDANGDASVDLADGIYLQRWLLRGGPEPVCAARMDVAPNGALDLADSLLVWAHSFEGDVLADSEDACAERVLPPEDLACGALTFAVDAPTRVTSGFDATVTLATPDVEVEGWQIGVAAEGCTIASATLAGTHGADARDGGARSTGYGRADVTNGGVVSAVALSWLEERELAPSPDAYTLLSFHVDASAATCQPCTLSFVDTLAGEGSAVRNMVARKGRAVVPVLKSATVQVCPG